MTRLNQNIVQTSKLLGNTRVYFQHALIFEVAVPASVLTKKSFCFSPYYSEIYAIENLNQIEANYFSFSHESYFSSNVKIPRFGFNLPLSEDAEYGDKFITKMKLNEMANPDEIYTIEANNTTEAEARFLIAVALFSKEYKHNDSLGQFQGTVILEQKITPTSAAIQKIPLNFQKPWSRVEIRQFGIEAQADATFFAENGFFLRFHPLRRPSFDQFSEILNGDFRILDHRELPLFSPMSSVGQYLDLTLFNPDEADPTGKEFNLWVEASFYE
jgi:hypothetical protein